MRQFLLGLSLSLAFIAGCVTAQLSQLVIPPAHAQNGPVRWQYLCMAGSVDEAENTRIMNRSGSEGWELVQMPVMNYVPQLCFKRPYYAAPMNPPQPAMQQAPAALPAAPSGK